MKKQSEEKLQIFRGTVRNTSRHSSSSGAVTLTFRLEQTDDTGDIAGYKVVDCYAISTDLISDGDTVEIIGRIKRDGAILPQKVSNLTTGRTFEVKKWLYDKAFDARDNPMGCLRGCLLMLIVPLILSVGGLTIAIGAIWFISDRFGDPIPPPPNELRTPPLNPTPTNIPTPDSEQRTNGMRTESVSLSNCKIEVIGHFPENLRSDPNHFGGYVSGKLESGTTYDAIKRADQITPIDDVFSTWFYVNNGSQEGWVYSSHTVSASGNCQ
jgi:hypothetical protein